MKLAAKRIVWGKFLNGGQTCIAVDHVYLPRVHRTQFLALCQEYIQAFYYKDDALSADFCQIINDKHFQRLTALIPKAKVVIGGKTNPNTRMIEPTVIDAVEETDAIMQEEIFGPLLPLIYYDDLDTLLNEMTKRAKPLALYFFSSDPQNIDKVIRLTSSGGVAINDVIMQVSAHQLPFGGVGNSGMGQYHGAATFKAFSHEKSVFRQSALLDMSFRYPPYYTKINLIKWLLPKKD
ncbi:Aldehyde dehydrogenase [bioreactor metagenome]|uniref:Aldehyde dehydrogenase n=1 Tax=bioreactor metagenome TaxID=1076179 RepID=A0A644ZNU8_9ZZZZ